MLVDISSYQYLPLLAVRYSEMVALENMPNKDKDILLPIITLRSWANAHKLSSAIERVEKAFGKRPWIVDIDNQYYLEKRELPDKEKKPVHRELESLKNPADGYKNWCDFIEEHDQLIPCLQLEEVGEIDEQIDNLAVLDRGIAVRFNEENIANWNAILGILAQKSIDALYIIIDYGRTGQRSQRDLLTYTASVSSFVTSIVAVVPDATFIISSTTFPTDFSDIDGLGSKDIYERQFFNMVASQCRNISLIYSDRGSTRVELAEGGWSGSPRIDYPLKDSWRISREKLSKQDNKDGEERKAAFKRAAKAIVKDPSWEPALAVWGAKEIEAASKTDHITNPRHSTAVRINIHLHRQLHYNARPGAVIDTDDDWVD